MRLSYDHDDLLRVLLAMSTRSKTEVPGAIANSGDSTYGQPVEITLATGGEGIIVRLHTGVAVFLNIRDDQR